jgi:hypothetical protein
VNGHPRDDVANDIAHGRPTLSENADALVSAVSRLLTFNEREAFGEELASRVAASPRWGEWTKQPDRYLEELDAPIIASITDSLLIRLDELRQRATERGWDLPE